MQLTSQLSSTASVSRGLCLHGATCFCFYYCQTALQRGWKYQFHNSKAESYTVHMEKLGFTVMLCLLKGGCCYTHLYVRLLCNSSHSQFISSIQTHLLLKEHGVDGLAAGQDHHGESDGHRHHKAHADHLCHQVGWEVHQHIASDVVCETDVTKEAHLVQREEEGSKKRET